MVASEATPWSKTGGLADVAGALPEALEDLGHFVTLVLPKYRSVDSFLQDAGSNVVVARAEPRRGPAAITFHEIRLSPQRRVVFIEAGSHFDRPGIYGERAIDYADNAQRFGVFSEAALDFAERPTDFPPVDVVHAHDWQTGLIPAWLRHDSRWPSLDQAASVFTVHNFAYQGVFPRETVPALGLPWSVFTLETGEFWGKFSFLKAGLTSCDFATTVSPTYADETRATSAGAGLEGVVVRLGRRYVGILNGIDTRVWNPAADPFLPAHYDADSLGGKAECKRALLAHVGLPRGDDAVERPLIGLVSRLVTQKGLDLIEAASAELVTLDASWVFLGTGEPRYERFLTTLAQTHPSRVATHIGFDERLAHLIEAGADIFLMPSEFEPCGLNQMYSLRYGTVPIVRAVGGLHDTVQPYTARASKANGFKFRHPSPDVLVQTVRRATRLYHNRPVWRRLMLNGMAADHSWTTPAREYVKVYRRARALRANL
jgi:starch synthase